MYGNLQTHTNIMEYRNIAVKLMTRENGLSFWLLENDYQLSKKAKGRIITYIKKGYFDNFYYRVNLKEKKVIICASEFGESLYLHKIGN